MECVGTGHAKGSKEDAKRRIYPAILGCSCEYIHNLPTYTHPYSHILEYIRTRTDDPPQKQAMRSEQTHSRQKQIRASRYNIIQLDSPEELMEE